MLESESPPHATAARHGRRVHDRRHAFTAATLLIAAAALVLRVTLARRSGLWIDEAQLVWTVRIESLRDVWHFITAQDSHPPLFYLLMRGWLAVAGDTEAAALAPGLIFGVALVVAVAYVGRAVASTATGLVAAVLVACSPPLAWHAAEARPYAFMELLCVASTYALWRAMRGGGGGDGADDRRRGVAWAAYAALMVVMLWSHHWAWLVWGGHGVVTLACMAFGLGGGRGPRAARRLVGWAGAQIVIVLAACAPLAPVLLYQARHAGHGPAAISPGLFTTVLSWMVLSFEDPAQDVALLALLAAAAATGWRARRRGGGDDAPRPEAVTPRPPADQLLGFALFAGAPIVAAAAASLLSRRNNLLVPHTVGIIAPCLILAAAQVIASLARWVPARAPAAARAAPAALATALLAGVHLQLLCGDRHVKTNARDVAAAVVARAGPDDLTLVVPQWYGSSFYYYYPIDRPRLDYPVVPFTGAFPYIEVAARLADPGPFAELKRRLADARRDGRRVWLVKDRQWADLSAGARLPPHVLPGSYREVAFRRAVQIHLELEALYGRPGVEVLPRDRRPGWSMMHVLLFEPP